MRATFTVLIASLAGAMALGCEDPERDYVRGRGRKVADLHPAVVARIYEATMRAAFPVGDPALVLRVHPLRLPRTADLAAGDSLPATLVSALRSGGIITGTCDPVRTEGRLTPRCAGSEPGYLVRFSDPLDMPGDTIEVFVRVEQYDVQGAAAAGGLAFENIYHLVRDTGRWRAAREARIPR